MLFTTTRKTSCSRKMGRKKGGFSYILKELDKMIEELRLLLQQARVAISHYLECHDNLNKVLVDQKRRRFGLKNNFSRRATYTTGAIFGGIGIAGLVLGPVGLGVGGLVGGAVAIVSGPVITEKVIEYDNRRKIDEISKKYIEVRRELCKAIQKYCKEAQNLAEIGTKDGLRKIAIQLNTPYSERLKRKFSNDDLKIEEFEKQKIIRVSAQKEITAVALKASEADIEIHNSFLENIYALLKGHPAELENHITEWLNKLNVEKTVFMELIQRLLVVNDIIVPEEMGQTAYEMGSIASELTTQIK